MQSRPYTLSDAQRTTTSPSAATLTLSGPRTLKGAILMALLGPLVLLVAVDPVLAALTVQVVVAARVLGPPTVRALVRETRRRYELEFPTAGWLAE